MNKKNLRFYEAPMAEVVELKASVALLAGSEVQGVDNQNDITGGNKDKWGDDDE